ncbi:MAG: metalloregulator ArsR/SmtB family transcription factor [Bryobacterales bacterium]|nr:metalloregulator ArsR/SmtB family transcription factor [Bryobacterales bacterium]
MDDAQFQRVSKALADPRRRAILGAIAQNSECCCSSLLDEFPVAQPTMSHHLKELVNAGLVAVRREAQFGYYRYEAEIARDYVEELARRLQVKPRRR